VLERCDLRFSLLGEGLLIADSRGEYHLLMSPQHLQTDLVYDVGLHKGEDAEFYLKKGFRVIAIEAVRHLVETSSERLRTYLESGQLTIFEYRDRRQAWSGNVLRERKQRLGDRIS
jgi:hypothetical protein